jgi:predicted site-specific integrase-resolvase
VGRSINEIGSGVNDHRRRFLALLTDPPVTTMVVEHQDRATRFGFRSLEVRLQQAGRRMEVAHLVEPDHDELGHDLCRIVSSRCVCLYGPRRATGNVEQLVQAVEAPDALG